MSLKTWVNSKVKNLNWIDVGLIKLSVICFVLMIAKLWQPLLSLEWYWYALIFVLAAIRPACKTLRK